MCIQIEMTNVFLKIKIKNEKNRSKNEKNSESNQHKEKIKERWWRSIKVVDAKCSCTMNEK